MQNVGQVNYEIEDNQEKEQTVHYDRLKKTSKDSTIKKLILSDCGNRSASTKLQLMVEHN